VVSLRFDPATGELDIDFALHRGGVASDWAESVEPGARVPVAGPPDGFVVPPHHDRYLFAGDLTALPQIARYLEELPRTATGWAIVEVADAGEEIALDAPPGFTVLWVHRGDLPAGSGDGLERAVRAVELAEQGRTFVWIAGEADAVKPLRRWARDRGLPAGDVRIIGYWKRGEADYDDD
jgi:NADPH-dependent ferric siderophore reductase